MNTVKRHVAVVTQPAASSRLGRYIIDALTQAGAEVDVVDALASKPFKLWPALKSIRLDRNEMWKRRWENMLFSSWAWKRNSRRNARLLKRIARPDTRVLQIAKEYFPHAPSAGGEYDVYILYTMKLSLADGITPWLPPEADIPRFLELETQLFQRARHVFTGGAYVKKHLVQDYGVHAGKIVVAGGGVHPYYLANAVTEAPRDFKHNIIFVGWDFGMKGGRDLLEAFAAVRRVRPELTLTIAGPDSAQQVLQDGVRWTGPVRSLDELISLYRESDLFVMPSLRDSFGFVFLEAMTQGVPCIGTNLNAMPEIIAEGETGFIVPLRQPAALAEAILTYYANPDQRYRMGQAALERVNKEFTWTRVAGRMIPYLFAPETIGEHRDD